jgi:hypothetical protein
MRIGLILVLTMLGGLPCGCEKGPVRGEASLSKPFFGAMRTDEDVKAGDVRTYHRKGCTYAGHVRMVRLMGWDTEEEAKASGYLPCEVCLRAGTLKKTTTRVYAGEARPTTGTSDANSP